MTSLFRAKNDFEVSNDKAFDDKKRKRILSASEEEDSRGALSSSKYSSDLPMSKIYNSSFRNNKPAELFRKDLISAMKLPDTDQLLPDDYWVISDTWKPEWERGVQVPVNPNAMPTAVARCSRKKEKSDFKLPKKYLKCTYDKFFSNELHVMSTAVTQAEKVCRYDLDDIDVEWLKVLNEELEYFGLSPVDETSVELLIEEFESQSFNNYQKSRKKDGIEFDEDVICDVCRSPDTEEGNEMVFCDSCNICVHQACYGITSIPEGSWLCCTCALGIEPPCLLCPCRGGAMKSTRNGQKWAHVSCALWIPEVTIGCVERMEPITKVSMIPVSRWQLVCSLCKEKSGACIQCSVKTCKTAYHVTCAFEHGLEMKAIIAETEEDGIKLKSFCRKHSKQKDNSSESDSEPSPRKKRRVKRELNMSSGDRKTEESTRYVASEFYSGISISSIAELLKIDLQVVDFVFQYWKLKRKANFNRPLLMPKVEELNVLGGNDEDYAKMKMFVHLRQDLERVRNLCYMVGRREKLFRSWSRVKEEIFHKQAAVMSESPSLTENEMNIILHANHGDSLYDRFYTDIEDSEVIPSLSTSISVLEGTFIDSSESRLVDKKFVKQRSCRLPNPYAKKYLNGISSRIQKRQSTDVPSTNKHNFSKSRRRSGGLQSVKDEDSSLGFSDFKSYFAERSGIPHLAVAEKHIAHSEKDDNSFQECQDDNKERCLNSRNLLNRRLRYARGRGCNAKSENYISNKRIHKTGCRNRGSRGKSEGNKICGRYSRFKSLPLSKRLTRSSLRSLNKSRIKQKFQDKKIKLQKNFARKRMDLRSKLLNSRKNITLADRNARSSKIECRNILKERYSKIDSSENSENEENQLTRSSLNVDCSSDKAKTTQKNRCLRSSRSSELSTNSWEETGKETRSITRRQKELIKIEEMSRELESTNITVKTEVESTSEQKVDYQTQPNASLESKLQGNDSLQESYESFVMGDVFVTGMDEQRMFTRSCKLDKPTNNFEILPRNKTRRNSTSILNEANNSTLCRKSQRISDQQVLSENNAKYIPLSLRRQRTLKGFSVPRGEENAFNFIPEKDDGGVCKEEVREPVCTTDTCSGAVLTAYRTSRKLRNNYISKEDTENKERNSSSSHDSSPQRTSLRCSPRSWNYPCPLTSPSPLNGDEDIQSPRLVIRLRKDPNFPDCARWQRDSEFDSKSPDSGSDDSDKQICKVNRHTNSESRSLHPSENGSRYLMRCRTLIKKNGLSRIN